MLQIQHFHDFIFKDHQALENLQISCSFLISDTHDSQSFANEISKDENFAEGQLTTEISKITSLKYLWVYGI